MPVLPGACCWRGTRSVSAASAGTRPRSDVGHCAPCLPASLMLLDSVAISSAINMGFKVKNRAIGQSSRENR